jgi:hypothetical protein
MILTWCTRSEYRQVVVVDLAALAGVEIVVAGVHESHMNQFVFVRE